MSGGNKENKDNDKYISLSMIMSRPGWTKKALENFLPAPSRLVPSSYNRNRPVKLFELDTIEKIEKSETFQRHLEKWGKSREARQKGAKKAVKAKTSTLLDMIEKIDIYVDLVKRVEELAIESHSDWQLEHGNYDAYDYSGEFLERITVNYIRHNLVNYDEALMNIFNKIGKKKAYLRLNERVYLEIAAVYPKYMRECQRQMEHKRQMFNFNSCI